MLTGELTQARPLGAHDEGDRTREVGLGCGLRGLARGAHYPEAGVLEVAQAAREIGDHHHRRGLRGARRDLADRGVELRGPVARDDDGERAAGIGGAQTGTEVVRVLHTVEHQKQRPERRTALLRRLLQAPELRRETVLVPSRQRTDLGHDALMDALDRELLQPSGIHTLDRALRPRGGGEQRGHAGILAAARDEQPQHALRIALEQRLHRVQAVHPLRSAHRRRLMARVRGR